ncbi:hypothetical protein BD410DRAFT_782767 [Rickenella mellea]|uniref:PAN2-PAN3 deadenylation complex catalytic subunit PAN2 n=1 Tax=Rickenella mellea TaxID=50990 RepID=A0A4Y7QJP8_9AGAM|nr:hypothetical protein BD410DRAFT_782767 [Rickenella mellea]
MSTTYRKTAPITSQRDIYPQPITALAFDPVSDTLWTGNNSGGVVAYSGVQGIRGVAFPVGGDLAVKKIIAGDQYVRALGAAGRGLGTWNKGGANKWYYPSPHTVTTFSNNPTNSPNIAISTAVPELVLINSSTGNIIQQTPVSSLITHLVFSHTLLLSGSADGHVRTHDVRVRSQTEYGESSVKAHVRGVQGLEVSGNLVFSIGWGVRQSRPFPDPLVKVFDLRTLKALPPVPFPAGPGFINTLPRRSSGLVITSNRGMVNIMDVSNPNAGGEFYQLDVGSYVSSAAVSPTGAYLAFGDAEGAVHLMTAAGDEEALPLNGFDGQPVEWADVPEPIPEIHWTDTTPLNSVGMPYYKSMLLSSWTAEFMTGDPYYPPPPKIPAQILSTMKVNDFVGYAALPKELRGRRNLAVVGPKKDQARFRSGKSRRNDPEPETPVTDVAEFIPRAYRKVEIEYSKFGVEDFDFAFYNRTEYSGLETHIMNSYTNAMVQVMHYSLPIRRLAKSHITTNCPREHCLLCELGFVSRMLEDARGTNCQASNFCKTVGALAQASNALGLIDFGRSDADYANMIQSFHRFLLDHLSSEGNAFPHNPVIISPSAGPPDPYSPAAAPITQLLGIDAKNIIVCGNCKAVREKENMTHMVDLVYPRRTPSGALQSSADFASILRNSLIREMSHKATCQTCKQFANFESRRAIPTKDLPPILAVNANVYNQETSRFWLDDRLSTFLKPAVELTGQVDGIDDSEVAVYEIRALIVQVVSKDQSSHLVAIVKVPEAQGKSETDSPWFIFNDFAVSNISEGDALSFPGSWKVPTVIYLERIDMRGKIDYSGLPNTVDAMDLTRDLSISPNRDNMDMKHEPLKADELPKPGTLVSIDAEFVSMQQEEVEIRSDGTKKVLRPARLSLARVSVLRGDGPHEGLPFIDDHIHTSEMIVDYLTEFSGIKYGDLDPHLSRKTLVPLKVAYKKLRLLVDLGCIFIGHGLAKDFRIINLFVPPHQVIDTVDVYFIKARQRRLSLRFLSWIVLKQNIQQDTHDSIEDARSALMLYKAFQEFESQGIFDEKLDELYREGKQYNWKPPPAPGSSSPPTSNTPQPPSIPPFGFQGHALQTPYPTMFQSQGTMPNAFGGVGGNPFGSYQQQWRGTR